MESREGFEVVGGGTETGGRLEDHGLLGDGGAWQDDEIRMLQFDLKSLAEMYIEYLTASPARAGSCWNIGMRGGREGALEISWWPWTSPWWPWSSPWYPCRNWAWSVKGQRLKRGSLGMGV